MSAPVFKNYPVVSTTKKQYKKQSGMSEILQDHYFPFVKKQEELELHQEALALESAVKEFKQARIAELKESHARLQAELTSNTHPWDEQLIIIKQMNALCNEIQCEANPHLKGQTCPICDKKFNGWGNNPAPLDTRNVCDSCNADIIVPIRMGNNKLERTVVKQLVKKMMTSDDYVAKKMWKD